jgi:mono/diheme cytochrome c family protein
MPPWFKPLALLATSFALIPLVVIAKLRVSTSKEPRIHIIQDMDNQAKFKAQSRNDLFADGRAMRPPVPGTVARGELYEDDHFYRGLDQKGEFADEIPAKDPATGAAIAVDRAFLERGRERFQIYCAVCHGFTGHGDGPVHQRVQQLLANGREGIEWAPPTTYHQDTIRAYPVGRLFHVITNGVRTMAPYGPQVSARDRWAIAAYIKALQAAQKPEN